MSPPGDKAFGGVKVPGMRETHRSHHDEPNDTPPSQKIRELVKLNELEREQCRVQCQGNIETFGLAAAEASRKASAANHLATAAELRASNIEAKFNVIITMIGTLAAIVLAVVGWLVLQLQQSDNRAREVAEIVAEKTVLAADRRIDERLKSNTTDTIRAVLDEQSRRGKDPDVVTVARTK